MKTRQILFSGQMIRAVKAGRKTVTRRVMKPQPSATWQLHPDHPLCTINSAHSKKGRFGALLRRELSPGSGKFEHDLIPSPYGQTGDRLRVKEAAWMWCERQPNGLTPTGRPMWYYVPMHEAPVLYAADHPAKPQTCIVSPDTGNEWGWRLKIGRFLPAWAVRIELEITAITVERLQDISTDQALAEGVQPFADGGFHVEEGRHYHATDPRLSFASLIEYTTGDGLWAANPWVWAINFKPVTP